MTDVVAPFTGAWIEIKMTGLPAHLPLVAPFTGAWIEIGHADTTGSAVIRVAPFMGAWIEMIRSSMKTGTGKRSHPSRVRGLKSVAIDQISYPGNGRTLHGCVD